MYDLHLHSTYSDGDLSPAEIVQQAAGRGVAGVSVTDHNGMWGATEARAAAERAGLAYFDGIELSVREGGQDVHVLGYSTGFDQAVMCEGLRDQLVGYAARMAEMVRRCQAAGYDRVTVAAVKALRVDQAEPCYLSYDVGRVLGREYGLSVAETRSLVTGAGPCAVPYGAWAFTAAAAVDLLHAAGGIALWAHPGLVAADGGEAAFTAVLAAVIAATIDGLEVYHPYHSLQQRERLLTLAAEQGWLMSGGSDWHGPARYSKSDAVFGQIGIGEEEYQQLMKRIEERKAQSEKRKTTA